MSDQSQFGRGGIIALAGRRVDPVDADTRRFPLENVTLVRKRLSELFVAERATAIGAALPATPSRELDEFSLRVPSKYFAQHSAALPVDTDAVL